MSPEYAVVNPATDQVEKRYPNATDDEIAAAVGRAHAVAVRPVRARSSRRLC